MVEPDESKCSEIYAQLCDVVKPTIHSSVKQIFCSHDMCELVWTQAKSIYTNELQNFYRVCQHLMDVIVI